MVMERRFLFMLNSKVRNHGRAE